MSNLTAHNEALQRQKAEGRARRASKRAAPAPQSATSRPGADAGGTVLAGEGELQARVDQLEQLISRMQAGYSTSPPPQHATGAQSWGRSEGGDGDGDGEAQAEADRRWAHISPPPSATTASHPLPPSGRRPTSAASAPPGGSPGAHRPFSVGPTRPPHQQRTILMK